MEEKKGWSERGEKGGRKATGRIKIFASATISESPEEIQHLKDIAKASGKSVSRFILDYVNTLQ